MNQLFVYYQNKRVGVLKLDSEERLSFRYERSWLVDPERFSLSLALKLDERLFDHLETKSFFENLLPEGEVKRTLLLNGKSSLQSDFGFLYEFGNDCAGALKIVPAHEKSFKISEKKKELKLETLYRYLAERRPLTDAILNQEGGKFSLAGAQDKFAVIYEENKIFLPLDGAPSTHIIKPCVRYWSSTHDTPYNEYFCMKLAKMIGLQTPDVDVIDGEYPLYLVERFDRVHHKNGVQRIHQQDFCQAQGITSLKKYESDGGPSFQDNYHLVRANSVNPIPDLNQLLQWMMYNLVIGNNDSHSKNLAFLHSPEGLRLAPFYDLLSTSIYKEIGQNFAFKIGGQRLWFKLKRKTFDQFSKELGLRPELIGQISLRLFEQVEKQLPVLQESFQARFPKVKTAILLEKEITKRLVFLKKLFVKSS